jgi:raffinose/stachyose/melibiose transport system substrate-binding protein
MPNQTDTKSDRYTRRDFLRRVAGVGVAGAGIGASDLLAACGGGGSGSSGGQLVFWDSILGGPSDVPKSQWFITKAIQRFAKANPGLSVNRSAQSTDIETFHNQFRAASIARNGPDVVTLYAGGDVTTFGPFLEPLDQYFPASFRSDYLGWESVREKFRSNGRILAIPFGAGSYFEVLYNKDLFARAGLADFSPPATWQDLLQLAQRLKDKGVTPFIVGEQEGYTGAWSMSALVGGQIGTNGFFDMLAGRRPVTDSSMVNGYENYRKLHDLGLTNPDASSTKNDEAQQRFIQGQGAMLIQGGWFNKDALNGLGAKVGNFPIPTLAGAPHAGGIAGGPNVALAVTSYSKRKDDAIRFLKFMLQKDNLDLYVTDGETEPSNYKKADLSVIKNPLLENQAKWLKQHETIYPFDNIMPQDVDDLFYRMNAAVFTGRTSPDQAVQQLQAQLAKSR